MKLLSIPFPAEQTGRDEVNELVSEIPWVGHDFHWLNERDRVRVRIGICPDGEHIREAGIDAIRTNECPRISEPTWNRDTA